MGSRDSHNLERIGRVLQRGVSQQVSEYSERFTSIDNLYEPFLEKITRTEFNANVSETAKRLLGLDKVGFTAVDGTMYTNSMFKLVVFYGGSFASKGTIDLSVSPPKIAYSENIVNEGLGMSNCVPLYVNQIVELDQS